MSRTLHPTELDANRPPVPEDRLARLLPAIQVAWADGAVQDGERALILALAEQDGLTATPEAMDRLVRWLDTPPTDEELEQMVRALRQPDRADVDEILARARAVAEADGGFLGIGAVAVEEVRTLDWLEAELAADPRAGVCDLPGRRRSDADAPTGRLSTLLALLDEQRAGTFVFVDHVPRDVTDAWPRTSPRAGERMPPAVFHVPDDEYQAYMDHIVHRYMTSMTPSVWRALKVAMHDDSAPLTDRRLERLLWETPFSRLLVDTLDPVDHRRFGSRVDRAASLGTPLKLDTSHLTGQSGFEGIHVSPAVALMAQQEDGVKLVAIAVGEHVFEPGDGEPWERARLFLTQGCSLALVAGVHATLHFPADSVVGVAREVFPADHPIARLIEGHAYLQLPLNYGVRWNRKSYAVNNPSEVYTALPVPGDAVFEGFSDYYTGIEGNSAYPGYRYPMEAPAFPGPYCAALRAYYDVVLDFCREVVDRVSPDDVAVLRWADALGGLLPGFPDAEAIRDPEVLARALAGFVHGVSIWHSLEHHIYSQIPIRQTPHRLRVAPPVGGEASTSDWERWTTTDLFRQELGRQLFYEAHTLRGMLDADYGFTDPRLQDAVGRFHQALRACESGLPPRYRGLDDVVACSIQF